MPANPLTLSDREEIRVGIASRLTDAQIARGLGRHRCTIGREIRRSGGRRRYRAASAQRRADRCRARPKIPRLSADPVLAAYVADRLNAKDSPWTISVELAAGTWGSSGSLSHETIYQAIYQRLLPGPIKRRTPHLQRFRRKRRGQKPPGSHSLGNYTSITERPEAANDRSEIGHLEGDLIVGAYNRSALITIVDRASRRVWLAKPASKSAPDVTPTLIGLLTQIPVTHTLTWDQGAEIARHETITKTTGIPIYITDPKSPWQRPTNENTNAHIRRYVGKGTNLKLLTQHDLHAIEHRLNTTPRRIFNNATANHIYDQLSR